MYFFLFVLSVCLLCFDVYLSVFFSCYILFVLSFFFSSRRRHTSWPRDWSSDVCSSDLMLKKGCGSILLYQFLTKRRSYPLQPQHLSHRWIHQVSFPDPMDFGMPHNVDYYL